MIALLALASHGLVMPRPPTVYSAAAAPMRTLVVSSESAGASQVAACCPSRASRLQMSVMPPSPVLAAACTIPTCLGFWKSEYGVSYGYGLATALFGALMLHAGQGLGSLALWHASAICFYGIRLSVFLLWREMNVARFRDFREKIEARAVQRGGRLMRAPFVLSCSLLYYAMCTPLLAVHAALASGALASAWGASIALRALVGVSWAGLLLAAWGDLHKSYVKAKLGAETLVMTGPYARFRHPNYTGEQMLWTANMLTSIVSAAAICGATGASAAASAAVSNAAASTAAASAAASAAAASAVAGCAAAARRVGISLLGWLGIMYVLANATASLEAKQEERLRAVERWRAGSWRGISLGTRRG